MLLSIHLTISKNSARKILSAHRAAGKERASNPMRADREARAPRTNTTSPKLARQKPQIINNFSLCNFMPLTDEQVAALKQQLKQQIQHLPEDKRAAAEAHIDSMSREAIEAMLAQEQTRTNIFRKIANKEVDSVVVDENSHAIAVLEIRPLSRGHVLVVPKTKVTQKQALPNEVLELAKKVGEKVQRNLKPKETKVNIEQKLGEVVVEVVPVYEGLPLKSESEREVVPIEELEKVKEEINVVVMEKPKPEVVKIEKKEEKSEEVVRMKRRIP
ncbi:HIT domain-containing protein [Candidatus Pacearchaeota archaeon]|nr:MAG: HIT domain-containing protein [Candidatus Pacearchaeota archaeon]